MSFNYKQIKPQKGIWVKCVDGYFDTDQRHLVFRLPINNEFYTIRQFNSTRNPLTDLNAYTILLNEIINPRVATIIDSRTRLIEPSFRLSRFICVAEPEEVDSTVSLFYDILNKCDNGKK